MMAESWGLIGRYPVGEDQGREKETAGNEGVWVPHHFRVVFVLHVRFHVLLLYPPIQRWTDMSI